MHVFVCDWVSALTTMPSDIQDNELPPLELITAAAQTARFVKIKCIHNVH